MCFYRTKLYKACGHTEFRRFVCNPAPINSDSTQSDVGSDGQLYSKSRFACGEQPQHVNDLERGVCGRCRELRGPGKGAQRKSEVLEIEQSHQHPGLRIFVLDRCVDGIKHDEKAEDVDMVPADANEDWILLKAGIKEAIEECRPIREEFQTAQSQISHMLKALNIQGEHRPVGISDRADLAPTSIELEKPEQPQQAKQAVTHPLSSRSRTRPLSHSATKVRRDLLAAKGRVWSMIQAIDGKSEASHMIHSLNRRRIVSSMANTINRHCESDYSAKPQRSVVREQESTSQLIPPLPPLP